MAITDWPEGERPREKLLQNGAQSLSDAELMAIFLRVGVTGKSAVDLARDLLNTFGSLNGVFAASEAQISAVHGMGSSKYVQLQAIFEMSRRALGEQLQQRDVLASPQQVRHFLQLKLSHLQHEVFLVLFLDVQHRLIAVEEMFTGSLTHTSVHARELVKRALFHNTAAVIFAHNHPTGVARQSREDETLTEHLKQALDLIDTSVLDHFIVAGNQVFSFKEHGLI